MVATITYLRRDYAVLETRAMSSGLYGRINISTSDKPAYVWRLMPPVQGCELPPYMTDNMLALVEVLSTRNPERQASRDLYVYELGYKIADALAA